jgi:uncharacterized membrane protein YgcG
MKEAFIPSNKVTVLSKRLKAVVRLCLIVCLSWLAMTAPVYARGGCFASGTHILTPNGDRTIEQLHAGDHVIGLNLESQQQAVETIEDIQVVEVSDYYVINDSTTVTGSHPFYVQKETGLMLVRVEALSVGDQLIGNGGFNPLVSSIYHYKKPMAVYNLISVTPYHNFYANGVLVHNKGGGGGGGSGGGGGGSRTYGGHGSGSTIINEKTLPGLLISLFILTGVLLPVALWREIFNGVRFFGKDFSMDDDLIVFTQQVNPRFSNCYSVSYREDNERWESHPLVRELDTSVYRETIRKVSLINQVSQIFIQYQNDWTEKNFDAMADYTAPSFHQQQKALFKKEFRDNFDVVYQPKIKSLVPIDTQQSDTDFIITAQIIATATNFEVSSRGRVISGMSCPRTFTEYWDIAVDDKKNCRLMNIRYASVGDSPVEK